jgi:hypothetical protein
MASEFTAVETKTRSLLLASSNIVNLVGQRVYADAVPENGVVPAIVISNSGGSDNTAFGAHTSNRIKTSLLYLIKAVTKGQNYDLADKIMDYVDEVLGSASGTVTENGILYNVLGYVRETPIKLPPEIRTGGERFNHLGAIYRVEVHKVSGVLPVVPAP